MNTDAAAAPSREHREHPARLSEHRVSDPAAPLPCGGSTHLDVLVAEVDQLVALLHDAAGRLTPAELAARRRIEDTDSATATLLLDGALRATGDGDGGVERAGTWLDALGATVSEADTAETIDTIDAAELERLSTLEHSGATAGIAADDLSAAFGQASADPSGLGTALGVLHARITTGLVSAERAGQLRRGPRVVHDASVGRVLYFPTDPAQLPDAWDALLRHVTGSGAGAAAARQPAAVRSALLHLELLRHQPFDAANGRVARAAARLVLLADDLLPSGLGAPDPVLAADPLGYHEEVAASARRRDATAWVERILEAQGEALRTTLEALATLATHRRDARDKDPVPSLPTGLDRAFTLGDVTTLLDVDSMEARRRCSAWVVAGVVRRVAGSAGLRLERRQAGLVSSASSPAASTPSA